MKNAESSRVVVNQRKVKPAENRNGVTFPTEGRESTLFGPLIEGQNKSGKTEDNRIDARHAQNLITSKFQFSDTVGFFHKIFETEGASGDMTTREFLPKWPLLEQIRAQFLGAHVGRADYWATEEHLFQYDQSFARRIFWKWLEVLRELSVRKIDLSSEVWIDWGCGSGVASESLLEASAARTPHEVFVLDRSALARDYAATKLRAQSRASGKPVRVSALTELKFLPQGKKLFLLSHVLNELPDDASQQLLLDLTTHADEILWVENGTSETSRALSRFRDTLIAKGFEVLAPCTHVKPCPVLTGSSQHWCHHFARVPSEAHQSAFWKEFSKRLGIDLRSLPLSFLVLRRKSEGHGATVDDGSRLIGHPRVYKGYLKTLECHAVRGLSELMLQKRDDAPLFKKIANEAAPPLYQFTVDTAAESVAQQSRIQNGVQLHDDGR